MTMFNEPEVVLIRRWADVRLLEDGVKSIRGKYAEIFEEVLQTVQKKRRDLNSPSSKNLRRYGSVGIAKKAWLSETNSRHSAMWIYNIGIENLIEQDQEAPQMSVQIYDPDVDLQEATNRLREYAEGLVAKKSISEDEFHRIGFDCDKSEAYLWSPLKESRDELLELLLKDEARGFIDHMVQHFEWLAMFAPVVDEFHLAKTKTASPKRSP